MNRLILQLLLLLCVVSQAVAGSWSQISNSKLNDFGDIQNYSPNDPSSVGKVISSFSGGEWNSADNQILIYGSGHCDGARGEIYGFDLDTNTWVRRSRGAYPTNWCSNFCPFSGAEMFPDPVTGADTPIARHSYDMFFYVPNGAPGNFDNSLWLGSGSLSCGSGGFGVNTWTYKFGASINDWSQRPNNVPQAQALAAWSTVNGKGYYQPTNDNLREWDPVADTLTEISGTANSLAGLAKSIMIEHVAERRLYIIGQIVGSGGTGRVRFYDLDNLGNGLQTFSNTGYPSGINSGDAPGCAVRTVDNDIYCWAGANNSPNPAQFHKLDMQTGQWTTDTPSGGPASNGTTDVFGHVQYVPAFDKFVVVVASNQNVFLYTPTGGGGGGDTTPPTGAMTTPSNGATVSGANVFIEASASDNVAVQSVRFRVDGNPVGTLEQAAPWNNIWDSTTVSNGTHDIDALILDTSSNQFITPSISVTVDNSVVQPVPVITAPAPGSTLTSPSQTFSWTDSGLPGVTQWRLHVGTTVGAVDLHDSGDLPGTTLSRLVQDLPVDGSTIHLRLWYFESLTWQFIDFQYTAFTSGGGGTGDIQAGQWIARPPADQQVNHEPTGKHGRMEFDPVTNRIIAATGDGSIGNDDSGNQEMFSYDVATDTWTQIQDYCRLDGISQPQGPDEGGFVFDENRNVMWWVPGFGHSTAVTSIGNCNNTPGSNLHRHKMMQFNPATNQWIEEAAFPNFSRKTVASLGLTPGDWRFFMFDATNDAIYGFRITGSSGFGGDTRMVKYTIATDTWQNINTGTVTRLFSNETWAHDKVNRKAYVADFIWRQATGPPEAMYEFDFASETLTKASDIPASLIAIRDNDPDVGSLFDRGKETHVHFDSVNNVVLWPFWIAGNNANNIQRLVVYHPDKPAAFPDGWEIQTVTSPDNATCPLSLDCTVRGRHSGFDPVNNALVAHRGFASGGPIFIYRYAEQQTPNLLPVTDLQFQLAE